MLRIIAPRCAAVLAVAALGAPLPICAEAPEPYPLGAGLRLSQHRHPRPKRLRRSAEPRGSCGCTDALALALLRNAELAADSYELRAREAALLQAGALPNPTLSLEVEDVAGSGDFSGVEQAQTTLLLGS